MADVKSRVVLGKTNNRQEGVKAAIRALGLNPVRGKGVLIKPNFNTADATPGSTHNDTLVALVEELWAMGAKSISLGERSYPPTKEVLEEKGIPDLKKRSQVKIINQEQIARAMELGLGASPPEAIELIAADEESRGVRDQIRQVLQGG